MTRPRLHPQRSRTLSAAFISGSLGLGVAATTVFAFAIEQLISPLFNQRPWLVALIALGVVSLAVFAVVYYSHGRLQRLLRSEARELDSDGLTARPYLITGFSKLNDGVLAVLTARLDAGIGPEDVDAICADPKGGATFGGWQQLLRLIAELRGKGEVRAVCIIDNGTGQMRLLLRLLQACFPETELLTVPEGAATGVQPLRVDRNYNPPPDYESYDYVTLAFDAAFARLAALSGLTQPEVEEAAYIDITPGFKVFSVAAAIQTLNRGAIFVYVSSNSDPGRVAMRPGGLCRPGLRRRCPVRADAGGVEGEFGFRLGHDHERMW